jgi:hypothetical protein
MNDNMSARDAASAAVTRGGGAGDQLEIHGRYLVECHGPDGALKWADTIDNLVTTLGKNLLLDQALAGAAYTAAFYMGLVDGVTAPVYAATDTPASHPGWTENVHYSQATLPPLTWAAAAAGVKTTSAGCVYAINTNAQTIAGCFIGTNSAKPTATGTMLSCGSFAGGNKVADSGDTLTVSYQMSL